MEHGTKNPQVAINYLRIFLVNSAFRYSLLTIHYSLN